MTEKMKEDAIQELKEEMTKYVTGLTSDIDDLFTRVGFPYRVRLTFEFVMTTKENSSNDELH
jgi:hypothetical protein